MHNLPILQPGDSVEIIAPASRCSDEELLDLKNLLESWSLNCIIENDIFGKDLLCANNDELRFNSLKNALLRAETKAIICARGGYGCMRLIPELNAIQPPVHNKIFVGMSDITALNLFLQQHWQWPVFHGALAPNKFSAESILELKQLLFATKKITEFSGIPLNQIAQQATNPIHALLTGGNLSLIQASIGTAWQLDGEDKIVFFEEIGERGYRVDRMLEHLQQTGVLKRAKALVFGDFINGNEPNGQSLIWPVIERFAQQCIIPVIRIEGVGHARTNFPLVFGTNTELALGTEIKLTCFR